MSAHTERQAFFGGIFSSADEAAERRGVESAKTRCT